MDGINDAIRLVETSETGDVKLNLSLDGSINQTISYYVAYLYPKGTFDRSTEILDTDGDGITFENAITSGKLDFSTQGSSEFVVLSFLPEGDYELILEAYEKYEFSTFKAGFLLVQGNEVLPIPVSINKGQTTEITQVGMQVVQ